MASDYCRSNLVKVNALYISRRTLRYCPLANKEMANRDLLYALFETNLNIILPDPSAVKHFQNFRVIICGSEYGEEKRCEKEWKKERSYYPQITQITQML